MSQNDPEDLLVPARLHDGWSYTVSLSSGKERYLHASVKLANMRAKLDSVLDTAYRAASIAAKAGEDYQRILDRELALATLDFDGARFVAEGAVECAGSVRAKDVLAIGYPAPTDLLVIDETLDRMSERAEQNEKADKEAAAAGGEAPEGQDEDPMAKVAAMDAQTK